MARIFVSSTLEDLKEFRAAVVSTLEARGHEPVVLERMISSPEPPLEQSRSLIEASDLFVCILAWRYGGIPSAENPERKSYVELELRHAWAAKKPTFVFAVSDDASWPHSFVDQGEPAERLRALRSEVASKVTIGFFTSPTGLASEVDVAVTKWLASALAERPAPPPDLNLLDLAFRLVIDRKADPELLLHVDLGALSEAVEAWAAENRVTVDAAQPYALHVSALEQLAAKYSDLAPNPLWVAWLRATRGHLLGLDAPAPGVGAARDSSS